MAKRKDADKALQEGLDAAGWESIEDAMEDSLFGPGPGCEAVCMNEGCDYTTEYEPDQTAGWCEVCGTGSCCSILVLAGGM